jgi:hypothetical protein
MLRERLRPGIDAGRVQFLGVLDSSTLNERLYHWADVLLLTSYWETGPIVIWEAMAHGLPVVSSRYVGSGLEGSLKEGDNCLLFPVGDVEAAAAQLRRATDFQLRAALAERGYQLVRDRYTREQSVASWDHCLRAILQQTPRDNASVGTSLPPAGRLDRWLGTSLGERIRRMLGRSFPHTDPGGEWPHANSICHVNEPDFWENAAHIDYCQPIDNLHVTC